VSPSEHISAISLDSLLKAYMGKNPPEDLGITFSQEDMLELVHGMIED